MHTQPDTPCITQGWQRTATRVRRLLLLALVGAVLVAFSGDAPQWPAWDGDGGVAVLVGATLVYAALLAVPFVPSVEIGLVLMVLFGPWGAVAAYLGTQLGLNLAYALGVVLRERLAHSGCIANGAALRQRLGRLLGERFSQPGRRGAALVALAALLNMPGNTVVGGGGGIGIAYGAGRLLGWPAYALVVAVATAALPALFLLGVVGSEHLRTLMPDTGR